MIHRATSYINNDEYAIGLIEVNRLTPDKSERHRYQIITVARDGEEAEFTKDLGKADKTDQLAIPSYMLHTVGELMDMAQTARTNPPYDKRELAQVNKIK